MTKAENRAAAKAFATDQARKRRELAHTDAVRCDLQQLEALRSYLIFRKRTAVPARDLIEAIDDYVEKLTGDRTTLHAKSSSIG